jgi:hypothetical protein
MSGLASARSVSLAERPDLVHDVVTVLATRWPAFMLAGHAGHGVDLIELLSAFPEHQVLLLDQADRVIGAGLSVPHEWDRTISGLPAGWDGAVTAGAALRAAGRTPTIVTALSVTLLPEVSRHGLAGGIIAAMKAAAVRAGAAGMLAPVRPIWKSRYPLIPMDRYADWRTPQGEVFDPWLRLHLDLGAQRLTVAECSLTVTGTVAEWQQWTGLALPDSGDYVINGGLVPLHVDVPADQGVYREPNVWVHHGGAGARADFA